MKINDMKMKDSKWYPTNDDNDINNRIVCTQKINCNNKKRKIEKYSQIGQQVMVQCFFL